MIRALNAKHFHIVTNDIFRSSINLIKLEAKDDLPNINARRPPKGSKNAVFVHGDGDLDL